MPTVGTGKSAKHFAYDAKGTAAAKAYAERTGKPLFMKNYYRGAGKRLRLADALQGRTRYA